MPGATDPALAGANRYDCVPNWRVYTAACYWAVMTLTSVGYGDVVSSKDNELEMWVATLSMVGSGLYFAQVCAHDTLAAFSVHHMLSLQRAPCACLMRAVLTLFVSLGRTLRRMISHVFHSTRTVPFQACCAFTPGPSRVPFVTHATQVIASFCGIFATLEPEKAAFRTTMDALNSYMHNEAFPEELRRRLREYFHRARRSMAICIYTPHPFGLVPLAGVYVLLAEDCSLTSFLSSPRAHLHRQHLQRVQLYMHKAFTYLRVLIRVLGLYYLSTSPTDYPLAGLHAAGYGTVRTAMRQRSIIECLSPTLQGEVSWHVHSSWLYNVHFLRGAHRQFLVELSVHMQRL